MSKNNDSNNKNPSNQPKGPSTPAEDTTTQPHDANHTKNKESYGTEIEERKGTSK